MIRSLYDWTMRQAERPYALWTLGAVSFIESSVFPIPPDVLLIPLVLAQRHRAMAIAAFCTATSVVGGLFGYLIGALLFDSIGSWIIDLYGYQAEFQRLQGLYIAYGAWIVFMAGLTPFPYKVVTIASGVFGLDLLVFIVASVFARGLRFFAVAGLLWYFGEPIRGFIDRNVGWLSVLFFALLAGGFVAVKLL